MVVRTVGGGRHYPRSGRRSRTLLSNSRPGLQTGINVPRRDRPKCPKWCSIGAILAYQDGPCPSQSFGPSTHTTAGNAIPSQAGRLGTPHLGKPAVCYKDSNTDPAGHTTLRGEGFLVILATHPSTVLCRTADTLASRAQVTTGLSFLTHCKGPIRSRTHKCTFNNLHN